MFNHIICETDKIDIVITLVVMYGLFITDMVLTFISLHRLKILFPKKYMFYERNVVIKFMVKKIGLKKTTFIYPIIGLMTFSIFAWYIIQPALIIGVFATIVFLIHVPNYFEIKKRLKRKNDRARQIT